MIEIELYPKRQKSRFLSHRLVDLPITWAVYSAGEFQRAAVVPTASDGRL